MSSAGQAVHQVQLFRQLLTQRSGRRGRGALSVNKTKRKVVRKSEKTLLEQLQKILPGLANMKCDRRGAVSVEQLFSFEKDIPTSKCNPEKIIFCFVAHKQRKK
jgi:hypothetical protein